MSILFIMEGNMSNNNILPAYTKGENLLSLIEILKKNNKNEDAIKAMFNMAKSTYDNTKSALRTFGIIEKDSFEFTEIGREIAYSDEENKRKEFINIVKCYEPYKLVLHSLDIGKEDIKVTDIDTIKNLWGKAGYGSTDRNRNDGATLFMGLIDFVGLGNYKVGRGGSNSTRIEWISDIKNKISELFEPEQESVSQNVDNENEAEKELVELNDTVQNNIIMSIDDCEDKHLKKQYGMVGRTRININVDMKDWSDEKIKIFFKYVYGKFEEE